MSFDLKEIKHIAELSRLRLTESEEKLYGEQISSILDYVKMLDEINLEESKGKNKFLSLSGGVSDLENVWRKDELKAKSEEEIKATLSQAELEDGYVKVKRVL
ncbi:aspartyl/glutamyl-tRNA amidotransferase subunit C [Candidatus Falkowbacteria bacterium]|nr:aspartyl/glutamyl-tRNA amidotransferase subunit C [Candidatus Falkowbacteria bacterium]NCT55121.1 aspartyl/glutamyl-tRNA amidotransferase subunit C [Candidatus Falkowbacteria bacterium]